MIPTSNEALRCGWSAGDSIAGWRRAGAGSDKIFAPTLNRFRLVVIDIEDSVQPGHLKQPRYPLRDAGQFELPSFILRQRMT